MFFRRGSLPLLLLLSPENLKKARYFDRDGSHLVGTSLDDAVGVLGLSSRLWLERSVKKRGMALKEQRIQSSYLGGYPVSEEELDGFTFGFGELLLETSVEGVLDEEEEELLQALCLLAKNDPKDPKAAFT